MPAEFLNMASIWIFAGAAANSLNSSHHTCLYWKNACAILEASSPFGLSFECFTHYQDRKRIVIGALHITPYLNDHSAYDAYSSLIAAIEICDDVQTRYMC